MKKYLAEMVGTMVLVLMGCGAAIFNAGGAGTAAWVLTVACSFGLSVVAMAYTIGGISGCHINPAITFGCLCAGRISSKDAAMYILFQIIGAIIGSLILYFLVQSGVGMNTGGVTLTGANGYGENVGATMAFIAEVVFTFVFVLVVLGTTDAKKGAGNFAGLAIGLSLILIHIACIPITGTSVNPARSIGPAIFDTILNPGSKALSQLWLFIIAPLVGGALSSIVWKTIGSKEK